MTVFPFDLIKINFLYIKWAKSLFILNHNGVKFDHDILFLQLQKSRKSSFFQSKITLPIDIVICYTGCIK